MSKDTPWIIVSLPGMDMGLIDKTWNLTTDGTVDPFYRDWTASKVVLDFYESHGIEVHISHTSVEPNIFHFHFPADRKDIAALFKLMFS